ncbi:E3 SUMO-protein ligase RanBP2-like [Oppia nitens]|uniref:E3 SUMO-protein ligase RanBP2-like n=1 Tax=Oppia nitens TaxID=1686743 RepID=UPI0023DBD5FA|nr:E3 SUMO-protein ligase RanBP2-like [Oppia nitens]
MSQISLRDVNKCVSESKSKTKSDLERCLRGLNFGKLYLKNNDLDTALKYANSYLSVRPNSSEGHKLLAQIFEAIGDNEKALINYRKALDLKKNADNYLPMNHLTANDSSIVINNKSVDNYFNTSVTTTPEKRQNESNGHSCGVCTNQSLLNQMAKQHESLIESNKLLMNLLQQNENKVNDIQKQLVGINEVIIKLTDSQNSLKDTIYEYMIQENNENDDEYDDYISDKENEVIDSSSLLTSNTSQMADQWQSPSFTLNSSSNNNKPLSELFKPATDSWQCEACYVQNNGSSIKCISCETLKPGSTLPKSTPELKTNVFQLPNAQTFAFKPSFTSSTTNTFKFMDSSVSSVNPIQSSNTTLFSNFSFGNTTQTISTGNSNFPFQLSNTFGQQNTLKDNNTVSSNLNDNKPDSFGFSLSPSFSFKLTNAQKDDKIENQMTPVVNEEDNSYSEVEPSNADNIYFQPVVPLPPKVDIKTGEEDENILYTSRTKLFCFCDNEWKERGIGDIKILQKKQLNGIRLLMRRDTVLKVCLNQSINKEMEFDLKSDKKSITWTAIDYSEETPNPQLFLLRFKNSEITEQFLQAFKNAKTLLSHSISSDNKSINNFNHNENVKQLTVNNLSDSQLSQNKDIEIIYIRKPQNAEIIRKVNELKLPINFYDYENLADCPGCRGCRDNDTLSETRSKQINDLKFDGLQLTSDNLFSSTLSSTNVIPTDWKICSPQQQTWITSTPVPLFSNNDINAEDNEVANNPDIYFKPIIPLPDLVEVQTGEEDEEQIYCQRAKLYRFDPNLKEWKERGIGDLKILKHNTKNRYRIILRRDQILKIACNHYITADMTLKPMNTSETSMCWYAMDYSDGQPEQHQFAIKLKNKELITQFVKVFNECKNNLQNDGTVSFSSDNENNTTAED